MNLRIAIIENDDQQALHLKSSIVEYAEQIPIAVEIHIYESSNHFMFAWDKNFFDIVFIDVYLSDVDDGTDIAKFLYENKDGAAIVFTTSASNRISEGYKYRAMDYLIKPITNEILFDCLDKIRQEISVKESSALFIKKRNTYIRILYRDILYFSKQRNYTYVHTLDEEQKYIISFKELFDSIPSLYQKNFVQCHRSYIVNIAYIYTLCINDIIMTNKEQIPLSESYTDAVREKFEAFYSK